VLLKADAGPEGSELTDEQVSQALDVSLGLVHAARQAYVEQGLTAALERKPACRHRPRKLDGAQEAQLVALTCSPAPAGRGACRPARGPATATPLPAGFPRVP